MLFMMPFKQLENKGNEVSNHWGHRNQSETIRSNGKVLLITRK